MSAADAQIGFGMMLGHAATVDGPFTDLVDLIDIVPSGFTTDKMDALHHQSPNMIDETKPGVSTLKELSATISWSKTKYPTFMGLRGTIVYWQVTYPDGSTDVFPGYITDFGQATPLKDRMTMAVKIQPTALATFTAAA